MKPDQPVLVQVVKEPIGTKGARLTSNISIAGRYLVLLPNNPHRGVSRKIEDKGSRDRLKKLIRSFEMPQDMGLICRTASAHATAEMLIDEATDLLKSWASIVEKFQETSKPAMLFEESDLIKRAVLTCVDKKFDRLLIDDYAVYQHCKHSYQKYAAEHPLKIEFYRDKTPMFERFNVEREIDRAVRRKIWLGSGGYLFFDRTEAMYTIDVNSGRSQTHFYRDVEESLVRINLEAAEEIARQLRLRNIGGLDHLRLHRYALSQKSAARPRKFERSDERRLRQMHDPGHERIRSCRNDPPTQPRIADPDDFYRLSLLLGQRTRQKP